MVEFSPKSLSYALIVLAVSSVLTGFFFSIGADLWQATKGPLDIPVPNLTSPFWYISVPLGVGSLILLLLFERLRKSKRNAPIEASPPHSPNDEWAQNTSGHGRISRQDSRWLLSVGRESRSYAMLYNTRYRSLQRPRFKVRVRVTPLTPYRFALGVWTSINPNEARNRLAILEVDDDAFRLTYTVFLGVGHQHIQLPMSRPNAGETYSIELEIQESPNMAHARVYDRENRLLCEQRSDGLGLPYASDDVFVGVAVWTDDVSCPLSSYEIEDLEIV